MSLRPGILSAAALPGCLPLQTVACDMTELTTLLLFVQVGGREIVLPGQLEAWLWSGALLILGCLLYSIKRD